VRIGAEALAVSTGRLWLSRVVAGGCFEVCSTSGRRGLSSEESQAAHTGLVRELWTVLSPAPRTIKAPYDSYHYTLSPFHLALAREAPTPDAPVTPSPWGGTSLSSPPLLFSSISPQAIRTLNNPRMPRLHTCACCQGINAIRGA
jgi:hypothetical protein